ncbi:hypothetical protein BC826DRAFT_221913 [Russula brevipes]|nr:hypothetical protein BC826DRAFT_221913 [Russula brevipes]
MLDLKRGPQDPILPIRAAKHPRTTALYGDRPTASQNEGLLSNWISNFVTLTHRAASGIFTEPLRGPPSQRSSSSQLQRTDVLMTPSSRSVPPSTLHTIHLPRRKSPTIRTKRSSPRSGRSGLAQSRDSPRRPSAPTEEIQSTLPSPLAHTLAAKPPNPTRALSPLPCLILPSLLPLPSLDHQPPLPVLFPPPGLSLFVRLFRVHSSVLPSKPLHKNRCTFPRPRKQNHEWKLVIIHTTDPWPPLHHQICRLRLLHDHNRLTLLVPQNLTNLLLLQSQVYHHLPFQHPEKRWMLQLQLLRRSSPAAWSRRFSLGRVDNIFSRVS